MTGTIINATTVAIAGTVGTILGDRIPPRIRDTAMHGIGLMTILLGLKMAFSGTNELVVLGSLVVGGAIGELLDIDGALNRFGRWVESLVNRLTGGDSGSPQQISRGLVAAALLFCVGPMTITGSMQDGLTGDPSTLIVKSMLDGIAALAFSSTMGIGVALASLVVLVYQGALTLTATWLRDVLTPAMQAELVAVGGLLIVGIGLNILELTRIRVSNMLPALLVAPLVMAILTAWF